ncbi:hypothetical protein [Jiangella rhizosphaerae]|uniref:hypothetical protein n=1 Tax=Jiangella rhizosphaerae TaxID=2293569 RepID=UPI00131459FF|nr:hypothetical protein [Jiangella rhizosphaerae]
MSAVILLLVLAVAIAAAVSAARLAGSDGGPRHDPLPRAEDDWSPSLPTHPYAR